jgi:hypothetical protein
LMPHRCQCARLADRINRQTGFVRLEVGQHDQDLHRLHLTDWIWGERRKTRWMKATKASPRSLKPIRPIRLA